MHNEVELTAEEDVVGGLLEVVFLHLNQAETSLWLARQQDVIYTPMERKKNKQTNKCHLEIPRQPLTGLPWGPEQM